MERIWSFGLSAPCMHPGTLTLSEICILTFCYSHLLLTWDFPIQATRPSSIIPPKVLARHLCQWVGLVFVQSVLPAEWSLCPNLFALLQHSYSRSEIYLLFSNSFHEVRFFGEIICVSGDSVRLAGSLSWIQVLHLAKIDDLGLILHASIVSLSNIIIHKKTNSYIQLLLESISL